MEISYPDEIVSLSTSIGTGGVSVGSNGFLSTVSLKQSGKILVSGNAGEARNPSEDFHLISFFLVANSPGVSSIDIKVTSLKDENKRTIGYPRGLPGSVAITLARLSPNEKLYILGQADTRTPNPADTRGPTPHPATDIEPDLQTPSITEITPAPTPEPEDTGDQLGAATPEPEMPWDYDTPNPEPERTPYPEPLFTPYPEPRVEPTIFPAEPTISVYEEPTYEPYAEPTLEPTIKPTVEPTEEPTETPTPEPTVYYEVEIPTPEITIQPSPEPTIYYVPAYNPGTAWFVPQRSYVQLGTAFSISIHVNTGSQLLATYGMKIEYNSSMLEIDTSKGSSGIEVESGGFLSAVNANVGGEIAFAGFDTGGKGPSQDLPLVKTNWKAKMMGTAHLRFFVDTFADPGGGKIGNPNGVPGEVVVQ
jgi:hypothetical protein